MLAKWHRPLSLSLGFHPPFLKRTNYTKQTWWSFRPMPIYRPTNFHPAAGRRRMRKDLWISRVNFDFVIENWRRDENIFSLARFQSLFVRPSDRAETTNLLLMRYRSSIIHLIRFPLFIGFRRSIDLSLLIFFFSPLDSFALCSHYRNWFALLPKRTNEQSSTSILWSFRRGLCIARAQNPIRTCMAEQKTTAERRRRRDAAEGFGEERGGSSL